MTGKIDKSSSTWLLWDGDCDFCRSAAQWITSKDQRDLLTIIPYQEAPAPPMTPALLLQSQRAVQLVTADGKRLSGAAAILFALEAVGWHAGVMRLLRRRPFIWGAQLKYGLIARNRGRLGCMGCRRSKS